MRKERLAQARHTQVPEPSLGTVFAPAPSLLQGWKLAEMMRTLALLLVVAG